MFIQIIGWLFVIGLIGSAIYSSLFHIGNFLRQKGKIQNGEVGEVYARLHKQFNWKLLIVIQLIKLSIAGLIIYFFLIPSNGILNSTSNWTHEIKREFIAGIKGSKPIKGFTQEQMNEYCNFVLNRVMQEYPDPEKIQDKLPDEFVLKVQREYYNKLRDIK